MSSEIKKYNTETKKLRREKAKEIELLHCDDEENMIRPIVVERTCRRAPVSRHWMVTDVTLSTAVLQGAVPNVQSYNRGEIDARNLVFPYRYTE